jgi:hypothetical protein
MRPIAAAALVALLSSAATAHLHGQDVPAPVPAEAEPAEQDEDMLLADRPHIQVLQHPYDISSFYRSGQSSGSGNFGYEAEPAGDRYPIASFYRSRAGASSGYSQFWTSGYGSYGLGARGRGLGRSRTFIGNARPRALGLNGDLVLFAPFLAPVGPLTGVFFER